MQLRTDARTDRDLAFSWLLLGGWTAADAYLYCYETNATRASAAVLATNKIREPSIQQTLLKLAKAWLDGELIYSDKHVNPIGRH